jgi:hypothetical protein
MPTCDGVFTLLDRQVPDFTAKNSRFRPQLHLSGDIYAGIT